MHRTLLVIDDDLAILDAASMLLEEADTRVCTAQGSVQALELLADGIAPDLILADYRLVGSTGFDAVKLVRAQLGRNVPAIIMSGDTSDAAANGARALDCSLLRKPFDPDRLYAEVAASLDVG